MAPKINEFFDVGKMPKGIWMLWFGISVTNLVTKQSPEKCFDHIEIFGDMPHQNRNDSGIGAHFSYTDFLYLYNNELPSSEHKSKYMNLQLDHKNWLLSLIKKDKKYSTGFFSFGVWNQLYLDIKDWLHFHELLRQLHRIYQQDKQFQKHIAEDAYKFKVQLDENQLGFFLEEFLMMHLIAKGKIWFPQNDFIKDRQDWILICYPGPILKWHAYLLQKNFFKLENPKSKYENCFYNVEKRVLYDTTRMDLKTYNYE